MHIEPFQEREATHTHTNEIIFFYFAVCLSGVSLCRVCIFYYFKIIPLSASEK